MKHSVMQIIVILVKNGKYIYMYIYIYIYIYILHIYEEGVEREEMEVTVPDGILTEAKNLYHRPTRMDSFLL